MIVLCDLCGQTFSSEAEAVSHMQQLHSILAVKGTNLLFN